MHAESNSNPDTPNTTSASGTLKSIATRQAKRESMQVVESANIQINSGMDGENRPSGKREVTLLSEESWTDTCRDLGTELPWQTRRANLLLQGIDLQRSVGCTMTIGNVKLLIHGETRPCALMDKLHDGLRNALVPDWRGGVFGQVLTGGTIQVGDSVTVES